MRTGRGNNGAVTIRSLSKAYPINGGQLQIFDGLDLDLEQGKVTAILGPSGCGKTTLLRLIAGLDQPDVGSIKFKTSPQRVGMVFQAYTAFPWLTVAGNIAFGLDTIKLNGKEKSEIIDYWLDKTGLNQFRDSYPAQLSGGMKQRLAFARTLAMEPSILLLDEPFGSLDAITRERMVLFCQDLLGALNVTTAYVTHSIWEALRFADRIVVFSNKPARIAYSKTITSSKPRPEIEMRGHIYGIDIDGIRKALGANGVK